MLMSKISHQGSSSLTFPRPLVTVDVVILTLGPRGIQVLLVRRPDDRHEPFPDAWALPGGFVDVARDEDLKACALRKLHEKTAVSSPYLEQAGSWGNGTRDPRGWSVTHVYLALLSQATLQPAQGGNATEVAWFDLTREGTVPAAGVLAFDHAELLAAAWARLQSRVEYTSLPAFLLPQPFTLPQLQLAYEKVLGRSLNRGAFFRRVTAESVQDRFLEQADVIQTGAPRAPMGYTLKHPDRPIEFTRSFAPR